MQNEIRKRLTIGYTYFQRKKNRASENALPTETQRATGGLLRCDIFARGVLT